jgi:predicted unusual protein kinase regulating ubiquinone biosynthesis (AarF/ABC1/UbiB family)
MILMKILPGVLKELTKHVPTVLFQVIEWSEITSEIPKITRKILQREGFVAFLKNQNSFLAPLKIPLLPEINTTKKSAWTKQAGEKVLEIYFAQIFSPHGIFLDLRAQNFSVGDGEFIWLPTGLWATLNEKFRQGLLKVYEGFYLGHEEIYYQGLIDIGLMDSAWSDEDKKKMANLFREQFGDANTESVAFSLEMFNQSMTRTFNFILQKKRQITKDFLYLGIYLVTLYSTLEKVGSPLPVKQIYLKMKKDFENEV